MEFFPEVKLERDAAEAIARGLYAVAKVDGLHEREAGLIASFWIDVGGGSVPLSDLERQTSITPAELAAALHSDRERQLFLKTAILLTWADGKVTDAEHKSVREYARALHIDDSAVDRMADAVKEYLLGHLAHLHNSDAATEVAKKLKV
jgi:tellurite resistance protein